VWCLEAGRRKSVVLARRCGPETAQKHAARARRITSLGQKLDYGRRDADQPSSGMAPRQGAPTDVDEDAAGE
jgi:hypothetical protein